ncbi:tRNA (adenine(22)-N(1))-methyltransferase [Caloramator mitchellensis]|uniref:tRNA (Adenine(22)-N(1))-methyltransferase n=1 Tax=Caloramator mitchellensis TaxID=908809 RepID=A0A0R3K074_CALMK|nr:class I SAM-dependent methyltransferase [Caloramator mitchellensis]KRQ86636.1 tRNA (adenine(22)-N(1))-methyltransferase [Caloramator mitchellensis]
MILSERLKHIVSMIPNCKCIADIGTDHGYIPIYAVLNGISERAIATDINKGPIDAAIKNFKKYRVIDKIEARIGDGLKPLKIGEADVSVIAGMGGNLIGNILNENIELARSFKCILLQPMQYPEVLRKYLVENNFSIIDEDIVKDENKYYHILKVSNNRMQPFEKEVYYYTGKILIEKKHPLIEEYISDKINVLEEILSSIPTENPRHYEVEKLLNEFKEVKECL